MGHNLAQSDLRVDRVIIALIRTRHKDKTFSNELVH